MAVIWSTNPEKLFCLFYFNNQVNLTVNLTFGKKKDLTEKVIFTTKV